MSVVRRTIVWRHQLMTAEVAEPWWQHSQTIRDLRRRALEDLERAIAEPGPTTVDETDPVVDELWSGACVRALAAARDGLAGARPNMTPPSGKPELPDCRGAKSARRWVFPSRSCTADSGPARVAT